MHEQTLRGISTALQMGSTMHAFLSGAGGRVVRLVRNDRVTGFGEHKHIAEAIRIADKDFLAGGREYHAVYSNLDSLKHGGVLDPHSKLDAWVLAGNAFSAWWDAIEYVVELRGRTDVRAPSDIAAMVIKTGKPQMWVNRGFHYWIERQQFDADTVGVTMECLNPPKSGVSSATIRFTKTGRGITFARALKHAFQAPEVEQVTQQESAAVN